MQYLIESYDKIQGVYKKMTIGSEVYYKVSSKLDIDKIKNYFNRLRGTTLAEEIEEAVGETDFLKGVLGSAYMFEIVDYFYGKPADPSAIGAWYHSSIILPLLCMSGQGGLYYVIKKIDEIVNYASGLEAENTEFAAAIAKKNNEISLLKEKVEMTTKASSSSNVRAIPENTFQKTRVPSELPQPMSLFVTPEGFSSSKVPSFKLIKQPKNHFGGYTLNYLNDCMRKDGIVVPRMSHANRYLFALINVCLHLGWVEKHDSYHYTSNIGMYCITYKPNRTGKHTVNKETDLPIQKFGLSEKGAYILLNAVSSQDALNELCERYNKASIKSPFEPFELDVEF